MKVLKVRTYAWGELSEEAKERALERLVHDGYPWWDWWKPACETIREAGAMLGFDIRHVGFGLFCHRQVFLTGRFRPSGNPHVVKEEFPETAILHTIANDVAELPPDLEAELFERRDVQAYTCQHEAADEFEDILRAFNRWALCLLEDEYEYEVSAEGVGNMAEANGWLFYEDGRLVKIPDVAIIGEEEVRECGGQSS